MKHKHLLSLLQDDYVTVKVVFPKSVDANTEHFFTGQHLDEDKTIPHYYNNATNTTTRAKTYTYKCYDKTIEAGSIVVVETTSGGFKLAQIVSVDDTPDIDIDAPYTYKWIVDKVNVGTYNQLKQTEADFQVALRQVEKEKRRAEIVEDINNHLPEGSDARKLFDNAVDQAKKSLPKL